MKDNSMPEFYEGTGKPMLQNIEILEKKVAKFAEELNSEEPEDEDVLTEWVPEWMRDDELPKNLADLPISILVPPGIYRTPKALADALSARIYPADRNESYLHQFNPDEEQAVNDVPTEMDQIMNDLSDQLDSLMHTTNVLYETLEPYLLPELPVVDTVHETAEQRKDRVAVYSRHAKELDAFIRHMAEINKQLQILNMRVMV